MSRLYSIIILLSLLVLQACRGNDNKADVSDRSLPKIEDIETPPSKADTVSATTAPRIPEPAIEPSEILASIDKHLMSTAKFDPNPSGGFTNGFITVTNTLKDASFQKAMLEVQLHAADGRSLGTQYYTVINIEAGLSKLVKIPDHGIATAIKAQIVKVKSTELTNGEFVLAGSQNAGVSK